MKASTLFVTVDLPATHASPIELLSPCWVYAWIQADLGSLVEGLVPGYIHALDATRRTSAGI